MITKRSYYFILFSVIVSMPTTVLTAQTKAEPFNTTHPIEGTVHLNTESIVENQREATRWSLSHDEYQQYQQLMQSTPAGLWYKTLDPYEVLGLMATSNEERQRYATLAARTHYQRAERELAFQRAFEKGFASLYPLAKPIATEDTSIQTSDELLAFIDAKTMPEHYLDSFILNASISSPLHIYVNGMTHKEQLSNWAKHHRIPYDAVTQKYITLNFDNGRFQKMLGQSLTRPVILRKRGSAYQIMDARP